MWLIWKILSTCSPFHENGCWTRGLKFDCFQDNIFSTIVKALKVWLDSIETQTVRALHMIFFHCTVIYSPSALLFEKSQSISNCIFFNFRAHCRVYYSIFRVLGTLGVGLFSSSSKCHKYNFSLFARQLKIDEIFYMQFE